MFLSLSDIQTSNLCVTVIVKEVTIFPYFFGTFLFLMGGGGGGFPSTFEVGDVC